MRKRKIILSLSIVIAIIIAMSFNALAKEPVPVKASGTLTSIEDDGSIIIDRKGYLVDPSVWVKNSKGTQISLEKLSLPAKVDFEYVYSQKGFLIIFIDERKK